MKELLKTFNAERRAKKDKWVFFEFLLDGQAVLIKSYNTWVQVIQVGDVKGGSPMELSVKAMNEYITNFCQSV